jgi:hypothetical protein
MEGIDISCYHLFLDRSLICHSLAAKLLLILAGFASTKSSYPYGEFKTSQNVKNFINGKCSLSKRPLRI